GGRRTPQTIRRPAPGGDRETPGARQLPGAAGAVAGLAGRGGRAATALGGALRQAVRRRRRAAPAATAHERFGRRAPGPRRRRGVVRVRLRLPPEADGGPTRPPAAHQRTSL